ncbi:MAG: type II toxin-antitoxin system ParD family antitoxin [Cyanobacteria bacterium J06633_23]
MLNISLPEEVQPFLENQTAAAGYGSLGEYVYHLIVLEQARLAQQAQVDSLLVEGLDSGSPITVTNSWWEQKRVWLTNSSDQPDK